MNFPWKLQIYLNLISLNKLWRLTATQNIENSENSPKKETKESRIKLKLFVSAEMMALVKYQLNSIIDHISHLPRNTKHWLGYEEGKKRGEDSFMYLFAEIAAAWLFDPAGIFQLKSINRKHWWKVQLRQLRQLRQLVHYVPHLCGSFIWVLS